MPSIIFNVSVAQVEALDQHQLPKLIRKLLQVEATTSGIPVSSVDVGHHIDIGDGGEDGRMRWVGGKEKTDRIPNRNTLFQFKATPLFPKACAKEVLVSGAKTKRTTRATKKKVVKKTAKTILKPSVKEILDMGGAYVLIENKTHMTSTKRDIRVDAIRQAIKSAGHRKWKTCLIEIIDQTILADWINQYPQVVSYFFQEFYSFSNLNFSSWETLEKKHEVELRIDFERNESIDDIIRLISTSAFDPKGEMRLLGLPGLGKTRILIEAVRGHYTLRDSMLYIDAKGFKDNSDVMQKIKSLFEFGHQYVLVVDNCDKTLHDNIRSEIRTRNISLITINHDTEEDDAEHTFKIKPDSFKDIIPKLVSRMFPGMGQGEVEKISNFAQGFPLIAVLLSTQIDSRSPSIGILDNTALLHRMLGIDDDDSGEVLNILRGCAIFKNFGFENEFIGQRNFIATHVNICKLNGSPDQMKNSFHAVCTKYLRRGIMEKVGRRVFLKPAPLALRLAADWWRLCRPEIVGGLLEEVKSAGLANELCDQVAKLDFLPEAKNITEQLCGPTGPFGNAEVLNTEEGSRLFRSIVEVNPESCVEALERCFGQMTTEQLMNVKAGRRNLVWALEKLCFRKETFSKASRILLDFAIAENETWIANNASGQFIRMFQAILSGTQASLAQRTELIEHILSSQDPAYVAIGFKALVKSVQCRDFSRDGGAENQGSGAPLRDFEPTLQEACDYWTWGVRQLTTFAVSDGEYADAARERLLGSIRRFASVRQAGIILPAAKMLAGISRENWNKITDELNATLKYETFRITKLEREEIDKLLAQLAPQTFSEKYESIIAAPSWHQLSDEDENREENVIEKKVKDFASEFVNQKKYENPNNLLKLYELRQQQGYLFGQTISDLLRQDTEKVKEFGLLSIEILKVVPKEQRNAIVLAGFLSACENESKNFFLSKIRNEPELQPFALPMTVSARAELNQIMTLFSLVDKDLFPISEFVSYKYGRALDHLSSQEVLTLTKKILEYGSEGQLVAIQILYMYCHNNDNNWNVCKAMLREIILSKGILEIEGAVRMDQYYWSDTVEKLLTEKKDDELALHAMKEIIQICAGYRLVSKWDSYLQTVLSILMSNYFSTVWTVLKTALLSDNEQYDTYFSLKNLVGSHISSYGTQESVLLLGDHDTLVKWCRENISVAPVRMMQMSPVFSPKTDNEKITLHPFTKTIIDNFGDQQGVLSAFEANLGTFSWTGSIVPLLEGELQLMQELQNHHTKEVRNWAFKMTQRLKSDLKKESNEDAESFL